MVMAFMAALLMSAAPTSTSAAPDHGSATSLGHSIPATSTPAVPDIDGRWSSLAPEAQGTLYVLRDFDISPTFWSVDYRAFADADASKPLFTLRVMGVYRIGGPSASIAGAYRSVFPALSREIVADSEAGLAMFESMGCALTVGKARDLVDTGCGFVPALMDAMGEYDLVAIKDGQLFFGDRAGDLTKARPATLYPFPLIRR